MKINDTTQVIAANGGGIGVGLAGVNETLTFISISLAILFTLYKFYKLSQK